jgi:hypothetical protein
MKIALVIIIQAIAMSIGFTQNGFELNIGEEGIDERITYTLEVESSYFISGKKYDPSIGEESIPVFFKTTQDGEIISHVEYYKEDIGTNIRFGYQKPNGNLLYFGNSYNISELPNVKGVHFLELDANLALIWEKFDTLPFSMPNIRHYVKNHLITPNNNIILQGVADTAAPGTGTTKNLCIYKYDNLGNFINLQLYPGWADHDQGSEMLFNTDSSGFYLFGTLSHNSVVRDWAYFDLELNLLSSGVLENDNSDFSAPMSVKRLSNGNLLMVNYLYEIDVYNNRGFEMRVYDNSFNLIQSKITYCEHQVFIPTNRGMGFIDENNIWVAVFEAVPPFFMGQENILFYIFDYELNMKGTKTYEGDQRYWLYDLFVCSDFGCIVSGESSEYEGSEMTDNFALKMTYEDVITYAQKHYFNKEDITIYPMPTRDQITISNVPESSVLLLYTPAGQLAASFRLEKGVNQLEIGNLPAGIYYALILQNQQHIQTLKIIKQ